MRLRPPAPSLRPFVGCFWSITTTTATCLRALPDACSTLCVEGAKSKGPKCFLIGPQLTPSQRTPGAGQVFFGVRLRPGVAFLLTRRAVHEVTDRRVALAGIMPDDVARMERQIAALVRTEEQLNILEEFLLLRLNCVQIDSRVDDALQQIERCGGELRGLTTRQGLPSELPPFGSTLAHLGGLVPQTDGEDRAVSSAAPTHRDLAGRRHCTSRGRTWLL